MKLIYVVEDHDVIRRGVKSYLEMSNFSVMTFANIKDATEAIEKFRPDLLLQDVMLPDGDGFEFVKTVKSKWDIPVVFMTAKIGEEDRIHGFELGADDYIVKPFSPKELVLRVQAIFKRLDNSQKAPVSKNVVIHKTYSAEGDVLEFDDQTHSVKVNKQTIPLTSAEFKVFRTLIKSNEEVKRSTILDECFGYKSESYSRIVDTHIKNIRAKLGQSNWIETIRGFGYRFIGKLEKELC